MNRSKITVEERNKGISELYQSVSALFGNIETNVLSVKDMIDESPILKVKTKNALIEKINAIFDNSNSILELIGTLGKIK